uniref:ATP synthase F0 subunit 8 n=1 Tax=Pheidole pieli TaxID=615334 RepID=UPI00257E0C9E|nr:ATP synthase F0 subunit 8 [Pheidole pieli]WGV34056.1 ATP synthase F0 subunit 8 [Pheidole pieli]
MPQMMPMLWMIMLIFTMWTLLTIIILTYFMNLPVIINPCSHQKSFKFINWNWTW